jgi:hypothetical protein
MYSLGVLPLLANASASVQPSVLQLLEQHYLPLPKEHLAACLPGLVTAVAAELRDPTAAISSRLISLLVEVGAQVGRDELCTLVRDCLRWSPHTRRGVLHFLREQSGMAEHWASAHALAGPHGGPAVEALCECLGDAQLEVRCGAAQLILERFPLEGCLAGADDKAGTGQSSPRILQLTTAILLLVRHEHAELRKIAMAWLQDSLPRRASDDGRVLPPACARAAAVVVAALEAMLMQASQSSESAAWPFCALRVLMADPCSRQHLLPRLCPELVRRLGRDASHAPKATLDKAAQALLVELSSEAIWGALAERWQACATDRHSEAALLATALTLSEGAGVLTVDETRTQQQHMPKLLTHVCRDLCRFPDPSQSNHTPQMLRIGLRLVQILLDRTDTWSHAAEQQIVIARCRCQQFLLWLVRTHVDLDFGKLYYRQRRVSDAPQTSTCDEMWLLEVLKAAYQLTTALVHKQTQIDLDGVEDHAERGTLGPNGTDDGIGNCTPGYEWVTGCSSRADAACVQAAIATEAGLSPLWLSLLHCVDASNSAVARLGLDTIIDICASSAATPGHPHECVVAEIMTSGSIFGTAIVRRAWNFLPSSVQVGCTARVDIDDAVRWHASGDTAVARWCQLQRMFPTLCSAVVHSVVTGADSDHRASEQYADLRAGHFRRYGLLCAVAFQSSEDLLEMLHCGILPMLAACTDAHPQVCACARIWLRWVIRTGVSWLLQMIVIALANAHATDDARAAYLLILLKLIVSEHEFFAVSSVHPAPRAAVTAVQAAGFETSAETCLQLLGDICLSVARLSTEDDSVPQTAVAAAAVDCLKALVSLALPQARHSPTDAADMQGLQPAMELRTRLIEPCLMLLSSSVVQHSSPGLQMHLLSLVRILISACTQPQDASSTGSEVVSGTLESAVRQGQLEAVVLMGLRHPHPADSPLLSQWLSLTKDTIAALEQTRASTLRAAIAVLIELLTEDDASSTGATTCGRAFILVRALADLVDQHLRGLVDLSAESLPADAFSANNVADKLQTRDNGASGLWGWRALVSSVAGVEEAEDVPTPPPDVQTAVVILQGLPQMVAGCVAIWHGPEHAPRLAPQRAEVARLLSLVWLARPFALFAGVLQWWLDNSGSGSNAVRDRLSLIEMLHGTGATAILAGEVLTVGCKVLNQLYAATRAKEEGGSGAAVELKWSQLLALPLAEVQPGWTSLMHAFMDAPPADSSSELAAQLKTAWPNLREVVHDSLHTALVAFHGPLPPAILLLRLLDAFIARSSPLEEAERLSLQDLTQRLVGQCLAAVPYSGSGQGESGKVLHTQSSLRAAAEAARLLHLPPSDIMDDTAALLVSEGVDGDTTASAVGLLTLQWLGHHLPAICRKVWAGDEERLASTLDGFVGPVMRQLSVDESNRMPELQLSAATLIARFAEDRSTLAVWRPSVTSLLKRGALFRCTPETLAALRPAVSAIYGGDPARLLVLLARGQTAGSALERASSFTFKRSADALVEREASLRCLTYVLWCGAVGQHRAALPNLVEALVEALEQDESGGDGSSPLLVAVFLCMRAIALRVAIPDLAPFWPLASAEMLRVLAADSAYSRPVVEAANKLLALLRTIRPAPFLDIFVALSPHTADMQDAEAAHREQTQRLQRLQQRNQQPNRSNATLPLNTHTDTVPVTQVESLLHDLCMA